MKRIILIRHGRVDLADDTALPAHALQPWIARYDLAAIDPQSRPSQALIQTVSKADLVLASALPRTHASALLLGVTPAEHNPLFDEVPIPPIRFPLLRLRPKTWFAFIRLLMLLRIDLSGITWQSIRSRGADAAESLIAQTHTYDTIVLVGHGGMHWLTQRALREKGWQLEGKGSHENWGTTILTKPKISHHYSK